MPDRLVRYEVVGNVAIVTLDRPEALNAFIDRMEEGLIQSFDRSPLRLPFSVGSGWQLVARLRW